MLLEDVAGLVAKVILGYILEQSNLGDKVRGYLKRDPEQLAFKLALTRTLNDLTTTYPARVKDLFDGPFLTGGAALLLARTLQPFAPPLTGAELADAWADYLHLSANTKSNYVDESTTVATYFLTRACLQTKARGE